MLYKDKLKELMRDLQKRDLENEYGYEGGEFGIRILGQEYEGFDKKPGYILKRNSNHWDDGDPTREKLPGVSTVHKDSNLNNYPGYHGDRAVLVRGYGRENYKGDPGEYLMDKPVILEELHRSDDYQNKLDQLKKWQKEKRMMNKKLPTMEVM